MTQKTKAVLMFVPLFVLAAAVGWLQYVVTDAPRVTVAVRGYDPRDLLAGHYIEYVIDWNKTDMAQFTPNVCARESFNPSVFARHRFYIPEADADRLDRTFRRQTEETVFSVVYSCPKYGVPLARQLLINGKEWREYLKAAEK